MTVKKAYVTTRYGRILYREMGQGSPLLLLHATPRSSLAYLNVLPLLAVRHRVIAADTLGFGGSDPLPELVSIEKLAESMVDLVAELGAVPTAVFGLHTGNKIGTALAAGWPKYVSKFILCGMTHSIIINRSKREKAIKTIVETALNQECVSDREKQDRLRGRNSIDRIYDANYSFDLATALTQLSVPTLILELATPAEDQLGRQAQAAADITPNSIPMTLEKSDRDILDRDPRKLADSILHFIDQ